MNDDLNDMAHEPTQEGRFFRPIDWRAFWTAFAVSFCVYTYTLAPTVTLEDSGELAVAGDFLGVPHPPGYPIWTMMAWIFTKVFAFVKFRGQPNPAWSIGLMSAVFGALATGMSAMLICRSGSDMLRAMRRSDHLTSLAREHLICWVGGVVSSLLFAFSPVMWSQSVIVEVYSLNAFFLVLVFLLTYQWMSHASDRLLYLTAFVFGLGLTNYQVLLLAALPLVFAVLLRDTRLFRDFAVAGAPYALALLLIKRWEALPAPLPQIDSLGDIFGVLFEHGALPPVLHPLHVTGYFYAAANIAVLVLVFFFLPRGRTVAITLACAEAGVAFYAYMPIVSDLRNPPMNWGYPRTWEGFKHAITRGQYERIVPSDIFSARFLHQIGAYLTDLRGQFTLPIALLGFLPFTVWTVRVGNRRFRALFAAIVLSVVATLLAVGEKLLLPGDGFLFKLPVALVLLMLGAGSASLFVAQGAELFAVLSGKRPAPLSERITVGCGFFAVMVCFVYYVSALTGKIVDITAALRAAAASAAPAADGQAAAAVLQTAGIVGLIIGPVALVVLVVWLMHSRWQFRVTIDHNSQRWIIATLLGFVAMSVVLIALANPKGDIQDDFIQRVKFISSHALFAFWIGYGLIFGLAFVDSFFQDTPAVKSASIVAALALAAVPLHQNAFNRELIRKSGGAEQNGHDFGWQFGNYQLRGANALHEELSPDEEPLPNPQYPPEMTRNAIFFGGTDPGRFVPTYMIYSARVREDVYLITQNALADNTYMAVMRDLYGDRIWIPSQPDSAYAFQRYVDEVRSGQRPRSADLRVENGRVQVSGALGVMEINGILAQMIFEHNHYRHDFYVEESYVIRWMYPYLAPHGLIMKINAAHTELDPARVRDDLDFWDWYTRRLIDAPTFTRDVVARKSFSKLRSAIAGLYANRRRFREAERAFEEARILYPLSPEANFRVAQEVLIPQRKFTEACALLESFGRLDPGNDRVPGFLHQVRGMQGLYDRIETLEAKRTQGHMDVNAALELADCYLQAHQRHLFAAMIKGITASPDLPPPYLYRAATLLRKANMLDDMVPLLERCEAKLPPSAPPGVLLDLARMYADANRPEQTGRVLERYLRREPGDWKAWMDMATVQLQMKRPAEAVQAVQKAVQIGGMQAMSLISEDPRLAPLLRAGMPAPGSLINLPGIMPNKQP